MPRSRDEFVRFVLTNNHRREHDENIDISDPSSTQHMPPRRRIQGLFGSTDYSYGSFDNTRTENNDMVDKK